MKCFYANEILYYFCMLPTKLSLLALYHRVFSDGTGQGFRIALWTNVGICFAWFIANILPTVFQCQPFEHIWDKSVDGACLSGKLLWPALNISNLLTDIFILVLPLYWVAKLHTDITRRVVSAFMLMLGASACGFSALRVYNTYHFTTDIACVFGYKILLRIRLLIDGTAKDLTCSFWTILESAMAILTACLPSLRPILPGWLGRRFSNRETSEPEQFMLGNASGTPAQSSPIEKTFPATVRNRRWSGATASAQGGTEGMPGLSHSRRCSYVSNFAGNNGTELMPPLQESPFQSGLPSFDGTDTNGMAQDTDAISPVEVPTPAPDWIDIYFNAVLNHNPLESNEDVSVQEV